MTDLKVFGSHTSTVAFMERGMEWDGAPGSAVVRVPEGEVRGGLVMLHGASDGRARQPLFEQVAQVLAPMGVSVLSYERRPVEGGDTPFDVQAGDAVAAMRALRIELRCRVGVFGFSQGAWAAALAAADEVTDYMVVLGCSGVSPAEQMRFYTDELLRRHGFSEADRSRMCQLRAKFEDYLRATTPTATRRDELAVLLRDAAGEPWFEHAHLPKEPPPEDATWSDMDFEPIQAFQKVDVPGLAMWGTDEECVPRQPSRDAWQASGADVTLVDLPACGHWPVAGSGAAGYAAWEGDQVSEDFTGPLVRWLDNLLSVAAPRNPGSQR